MTRTARRIPVIPTILVTLAIAAMIGLGLWQLLDRLPKKEAFLAQLAANPAKPPMAFPRIPDETLLFRRASSLCLQPTAIKLAGVIWSLRLAKGALMSAEFRNAAREGRIDPRP